jgi:hypothetical protein
LLTLSKSGKIFQIMLFNLKKINYKMLTTTKISARCECGALTLDIKDTPVVQLVCHCSDCRAFSGMPYTEAAFFKAEACSVHGQAVALEIVGSTGMNKTHYSCPLCETPLFVKVAALNGAWAVVASRLLPFKFEPDAHVWTSQKVDDVTITADITQSLKMPTNEIAKTMISSFWGKK